MSRIVRLFVHCWLALIGLLISLSSFAENTIVDPTAISISPWKVMESGGRSPLDEPTHATGQWHSIKDYSLPYFHLPIQDERWFKASFIIGWHFKNSQLALSLGPLFADAEVFVNGVNLSALAPNQASRSFRRSQTKIYLLPRNKLWYSFLDFKKDNQIWVHLMSNKEPLMLKPHQIKVANYEALALQAKDSDTLIKIAQGGMVALLLAFCLFSIFMRAVGFKERENNLFGSYVICVAGGILSDSLLLPDYVGYWSAHSILPLLFAAVAVLILVTLLSPKQRLSAFSVVLVLVNVLVLFCLLVNDDRSFSSQWLEVLNQLINMMIILQALVISIIRAESASPLSNRLLLVLVLLGSGGQFYWAFDYSPVQPFNITLFIAAIVLLLNVAQRFKAMASSLLALSNRLVSIREKERARLTRDIHDGVGQGLSTLKLLINLNASKLPESVGDMLKTEVSTTSETLKSVIRNLKPIEVRAGSPTQAVISLAQHNCQLSEIALNVFSKEDVVLSQERAYQVYRIGQEALNNAIKHSGAKEITLSFEVIGAFYRVQITDDGKGLKDEVSEDSYGMSSMHERTMILGANLTINNRESGGTTVLLEVPIND